MFKNLPRIQVSFFILIAAFLIGLPYIFSSAFALTLLCKIGVLVIFSLAYNMLLGQTGLLSFGHAIYFGLAGYSTIHLLNGINLKIILNIPVFFLPVLGFIVGLILGFLIGYLSTKRIGTAFAMISLGFCELITALTLIFVIFFNGEDGIQADRVTGQDMFGISYGPQSEVYFLILFWTLLCTTAMYLLTKTPFGQMCNAIRENPQRAEFVGYNITKVRWLAFILSAGFAGAAGSLHAINYEHIGFESVSLVQSGFVLFNAYIGGVGNFFGPIIGAISLTYLDTVLSDITEAWVLYFGIIFVLVVAFAPQGIAGLITMHGPIIRIKPSLFFKLLKPYFFLIISSVILVVGFTTIIELIHSFNLDKEYTNAYWIKLDNYNFFTWLIFTLFTITGLILCRRHFIKTKVIWNEIMEEIKIELKQ